MRLLHDSIVHTSTSLVVARCTGAEGSSLSTPTTIPYVPPGWLVHDEPVWLATSAALALDLCRQWSPRVVVPPFFSFEIDPSTHTVRPARRTSDDNGYL